MAKAAWLAAVGVAVLAGSARGGGGATIEWLESSDPDLFLDQALDVSADGTWVVGAAGRRSVGPSGESWRYVPFVWSRAGGIVELPTDPLSQDAIAIRVSDDGHLIAGGTPGPGQSFSEIGMLWRTTDFQTYSVERRPDLGFITGFTSDGSRAVGYQSQNNRYRPFLYDFATGQTTLPIPSDAELGAVANDISDDGTIVGYSRHILPHVITSRAIIWHPDGTLEVIGPELLDGRDDSSSAESITPDGRFIAGRSPNGPRWSSDLGWHDPTNFDDHDARPRPARIFPSDISGNGTVIIGDTTSAGCHFFDNGPAIWLEDKGSVRLWEWLHEIWHLPIECLLDTARMSDDGRVIVGMGEGPSGHWQPYVLTLPPPCTADTNADNLVDGRDLSLILSAYGRQTPPGLGPDLNDDGRVNGSDLSILLFNFGDPC